MFQTPQPPTQYVQLVDPDSPETGYEGGIFIKHKKVRETFHRQGYRFQAPPNSISIFDVEVTDQILMQGGQYSISPERTLGDKMQFSVVDKNDVLGMFSSLGLQVGTDVLELSRYVQDEYPPPGSDWFSNNVQPTTVGDVTQGLFMRAQYENTNLNNTVEIIVSYEWFRV